MASQLLQRAMKSKLTFILLAALIVIAAGWFVGVRQKSLTIPNVDDIICMTFTASSPDPAATDFSVPQSHYEDVLSLFRDAEVDWSPAKWVSFGDLKIETKNQVFSYSLFLTRGTTGAFRNSKYNYYRGTSDNAIIATMNNARKNAEMAR